MVTDCDTRENDCGPTNPNVGAQSRRCNPHGGFLINGMMICVKDRGKVADSAIIADDYPAVGDYRYALIDEYALTNDQLAP